MTPPWESETNYLVMQLGSPQVAVLQTQTQHHPPRCSGRPRSATRMHIILSSSPTPSMAFTCFWSQTPLPVSSNTDGAPTNRRQELWQSQENCPALGPMLEARFRCFYYQCHPRTGFFCFMTVFTATCNSLLTRQPPPSSAGCLPLPMLSIWNTSSRPGAGMK